ncbi:acyl-CoA N-acyltransferase [Lenzites betulinus]|nr:acyl-CoA N-acyltransferase [Lenzites betulinus]
MVSLRVARAEDLQGMQACNLQNLPENYTMRYYLFYLLSYPQVSYVAEDEGKIVGYILARMADEVLDGEEPHGHVVSISVLRAYRRLGLARKLMVLAQQAMVSVYRASYVTLHVRKSNRAAFKLYQDALAFRVVETEKSYYADGEDAYVMRRSFKEPSE